MLYTKPKDLKFTDMCIYIDNQVKKGNPSEEEINLIFEYLYHLSFMLAHKHKYFKEGHYYEEFALFLATDVLYRLFYNPKLNQVDENGKPLLAPIKSVLNYMKAIIYGRKRVFENENYSQKITIKNNSEYDYESDLASKLEDNLIYNSDTDVDLYLKSVSKELKHIVYSTCNFTTDKIFLKNIYISCLLSVVNSLTFTEADLENIENTYSLPESKYKYISRLYKKNRDNCVILYNLPDSYKDYVTVMVRRIFKSLETDILDLCKKDVVISSDVLSELVYLELDGKVNL